MTFPLNATVVAPKQSRMLVTVATYNEIENLPRLVEAIWEVAPQADVLVIDDNSPDRPDQLRMRGARREGRRPATKAPATSTTNTMAAPMIGAIGALEVLVGVWPAAASWGAACSAEVEAGSTTTVAFIPGWVSVWMVQW